MSKRAKHNWLNTVWCLVLKNVGECVESGRSEINYRQDNFFKQLTSAIKNITRLITNLPFVFQICCFICPQVQKDSKAVHLLMSISCKIDVISLKLKQIGQFTKRFPRLHILAPYIRKIYGDLKMHIEQWSSYERTWGPRLNEVSLVNHTKQTSRVGKWKVHCKRWMAKVGLQKDQQQFHQPWDF